MKISVIIPAFNAEDSIGRCLKSVLCEEVEVIVIDDGSTDGTADIVRSFQRTSPDLRLIIQDNRGVSAARNTGLDACGGDYVVFVDSDDTVTSGALDCLKQASDEFFSDIMVMRSYAGEQERYPWKSLFSEGRKYSCGDLMKKAYLRGSVCGCVFSRAFVNNNSLRFQDGLSHSEDVIFMSMALSAGACVVFRDMRFYEVDVRADSASQRVDGSFFLRYRAALLASERLIKDDSIRVETSLRLVLGMTHTAIRNGMSATDAYSAFNLGETLPLRGRPLHPRSRRRLFLLNFSYPLFYACKKLAEKGK